MKEKKYLLGLGMIVLLGLIVFALPTIMIDPYFHYHKPSDKYAYELSEPRYQNSGILRHFDYDAIVIGTSMMQCAKTSDIDRLFGTHTVKIPLKGASYKELKVNTELALESNPELKMVIRYLDYNNLIKEKNFEVYEDDENYPYYLINRNWLDDVYYLFNVDILWEDLLITRSKEPKGLRTSFDAYDRWEMPGAGKEYVLTTYERSAVAESVNMSSEDEEMIRENIQYNVTALVERYPDVEFYFCFSPYSICYWDNTTRRGLQEYMLTAEKIAIEELLKYDNVKLFSFTNREEIIADLSNYKDQAHYGDWINAEMTECMAQGKYQITRENYLQYEQEVAELIQNYDYDSIYE